MIFNVARQEQVNELNSNLEFHVGDTFSYSKAIFGTGLSSSNGKAFSFAVYLPKNISSDVTSVTVTSDISNIRTTGKNVPLTNAYTQVLAFSQNMVEVALYSDDISALAYHTGVIRPPVTFTFE